MGSLYYIYINFGLKNPSVKKRKGGPLPFMIFFRKIFFFANRLISTYIYSIETRSINVFVQKNSRLDNLLMKKTTLKFHD